MIEHFVKKLASFLAIWCFSRFLHYFIVKFQVNLFLKSGRVNAPVMNLKQVGLNEMQLEIIYGRVPVAAKVAEVVATVQFRVDVTMHGLGAV